MKLIFMGTPDFAVPTLEQLIEAGHEVDLVVTKPDAVRDRGKKVKFSPVKEVALSHDIPVLQPEKIKDNGDFEEALKAVNADAIVVVAYGKILPKSILDIPPLGCFNVHGSLLPKYRGPAPVQWSVIEGDEETGITIMYMAEGMDTGDMLATAKTPIEGKTGGELSDELAEMGAKLMVETLAKAEKGELTPVAQNEADATYAPLIFKQEGLLDFEKPAKELARRCQGLSPWPGTFTYLKGDIFKIHRCEALEEAPQGALQGAAPGTVALCDGKHLVVACGKGFLSLLEVQLPGKKATKIEDFLRGHSVETGTLLG